MTRRTLIALALGAYILGLIVTAPATLVDAGLQRASNGALRLAEARGTLWSGSGQIELLDAGRRSGVAKSITWRVRPASLLLGRLACEVELDRSGKRFPVTATLTRIEIADADIYLPAAVLGLAAPKLAPLELTGEMLIRVANVAIGRSRMTGNATLQWRAAGSALTTVAPLGDYELRVEGEEAVVHATLRTLQGPIQLEGEGRWKYGDRPSIVATARVPPQHQQQLAPLLRLIAVERSDGSFRLQLN